MTQPAKTGIALGLLAALAALVWRTMQPGRMQSFTWVVLAFFAIRILLGNARARTERKTRYDGTDASAEDTPGGSGNNRLM